LVKTHKRKSIIGTIGEPRRRRRGSVEDCEESKRSAAQQTLKNVSVYQAGEPLWLSGKVVKMRK
jgi:hypothetical protein